MTYEAPDLDFEMTYTVRTTHPLEPTVGSPFGPSSSGKSARQLWTEPGSKPTWPAQAWTGCP